MWRKSDESKLNSPGASASPNPAPQNSPATAQSSSSAAPATVSRGIKIKGEISGQGDFLIDGEFEGKVHLPDGTFTVGPNASVTAEIEAREIIIHGEMVGTLKAHERVHIWSTGKLTGNMETRGIAIEDGAVLHSKIAVPHAAPRGAAAKKVPVPQAVAPKAPAAPEPALLAAAPNEIASPEARPDAKLVALPEVPAENDQPSRAEAEVAPRAKRAAASTSPPASPES
jgi:cytoskeletal protein CcmA (bactofilin family)